MVITILGGGHDGITSSSSIGSIMVLIGQILFISAPRLKTSIKLQFYIFLSAVTIQLMGTLLFITDLQKKEQLITLITLIPFTLLIVLETKNYLQHHVKNKSWDSGKL